MFFVEREAMDFPEATLRLFEDLGVFCFTSIAGERRVYSLTDGALLEHPSSTKIVTK
jgi:hypothetical protein